MTALEISHFFKKNLRKSGKDLISLFENRKLEVKKIKILKEKLIIGDQYKITSLAILKNNFPKKIIFEIHDNLSYFKRSLFALRELNKKEIGVPKLFGINSKLKIIYREYLGGNFFHNLILKKKLNLKQIQTFTKTAACYLYFFHNFKFSKVPQFLLKRLNKKIEKIILGRTLEFIKPNIESLRPIIKRNLKTLFKKMYRLEKINKRCLIHGDYQPANFILSPRGEIHLMDFDTLEIGNPARDLGRFLSNITYLLRYNKYSLNEIEKIENLFLKDYLCLGKVNFYPDLKTNINIYKAEMIQYIILGEIWEDKIPDPGEIKTLINHQQELLNL